MTSKTPQLLFTDPGDPVTCESAVFSWIYDGPIASLSLFISNDDIDQNGPSTSSRPLPTFTNTINFSQRRPDTLIFQIALELNPASGNFNWSDVAVPQGWYFLSALIDSKPPYLTRSSTFHVQQKVDTSCLALNLIRSLPSPSPSLSFTATTSSIPTPTPPQTASPPVAHAALSFGVPVGAIFLLAILAILAFCLYYRIHRQRFRSIPHFATYSSTSSLPFALHTREHSWSITSRNTSQIQSFFFLPTQIPHSPAVSSSAMASYTARSVRDSASSDGKSFAPSPLLYGGATSPLFDTAVSPFSDANAAPFPNLITPRAPAPVLRQFGRALPSGPRERVNNAILDAPLA